MKLLLFNGVFGFHVSRTIDVDIRMTFLRLYSYLIEIDLWML